MEVMEVEEIEASEGVMVGVEEEEAEEEGEGEEEVDILGKRVGEEKVKQAISRLLLMGTPIIKEIKEDTPIIFLIPIRVEKVKLIRIFLVKNLSEEVGGRKRPKKK